MKNWKSFGFIFLFGMTNSAFAVNALLNCVPEVNEQDQFYLYDLDPASFVRMGRGRHQKLNLPEDFWLQSSFSKSKVLSKNEQKVELEFQPQIKLIAQNQVVATLKKMEVYNFEANEIESDERKVGLRLWLDHPSSQKMDEEMYDFPQCLLQGGKIKNWNNLWK